MLELPVLIRDTDVLAREYNADRFASLLRLQQMRSRHRPKKTSLVENVATRPRMAQYVLHGAVVTEPLAHCSYQDDDDAGQDSAPEDHFKTDLLDLSQCGKAAAIDSSMAKPETPNHRMDDGLELHSPMSRTHQADCSIYTIDPSPMYRLGTYSSFANAYFPSSSTYAPQTDIVLSVWLSPPTTGLSALVRTMNDAAALLQLASATGDQGILLEARRRHAVAVTGLRQALEQPRQGAEADSLLSASQVLLICGIYAQVSVGQNAWQTHVKGTLAIAQTQRHLEVQARRELRSPPSPFQSFLFRSLRMFGLAYGLVERKALSSSLICQARASVPKGGRDRLVQLAWRLPSLLELTETVRSAGHRPNHSSVIQMREQLVALEKELEEWESSFSHRHPRFSSSRSPTPHPPAPKGHERYCPALCFTNLIDATYYTIYWICLLLLRQCIYDLTSPRSSATTAKPPNEVLASVDEVADLLCESIPYLSATADGNVSRAMAVRGPLYFASQWFERSKAVEKLQWCRDVESRIRQEAPALQWDALLPWMFFAAIWLGLPEELRSHNQQ